MADKGPRAYRTAHHPVPARARRRGHRVLRALRLVHPFPTLLNAVAVVLLALVAACGRPEIGVVVRLAATMLAVQSAVGIVNDCADRDLDAAAKSWKPIPAGVVSVRTAWWLGALAAALALFLGATLGPAAWLLSTAGLGAGLAYDLWLKRTPFSGLTYAVALPLVPLWVWTALGRFTPALLWAWPVGALLGGALHLANALPDLEADAAAGVRGLAQRLGRRRALAGAWGGYLAAVLLATALGLLLGYAPGPLLSGAAAALGLLGAAVAAFARRPGPLGLRLGWSLLAPGAALLAVTWLAALP
jgi:4-hydroxybenzoate polyprenyltransferase